MEIETVNEKDRMYLNFYFLFYKDLICVYMTKKKVFFNKI